MIEHSNEAAGELALSRARIYHLLGTAHIKPHDSDFLRLLAGWVAAQAGGQFQLPSEQIKQGLLTLRHFFEKAGPDSEAKLEEVVATEFTRLLRGVKPLYSPLPPYESVYREEAGRVFSQSTSEVREVYRRFGFDLAERFGGEPPDHVSFELEFVGLLCGREAEAWRENDEDAACQYQLAERDFIAEHLQTWLPELCGEIRRHDRLRLFHGIADLTEGWVIFDYSENLQGLSYFAAGTAAV